MKHVGELGIVPDTPRELVESLLQEPYERLLLELPEDYDTDDEVAYFDRLARDFTQHTFSPFEGSTIGAMNRAYDKFPRVFLYRSRLANAEEDVLLHIIHTDGEETTFNYGADEYRAIVDSWTLYDIYTTHCINAERYDPKTIVDDPIRFKDTGEPITFGTIDDTE